MANVKVTLDYQINDGMSLTFKAPCDCTAVTGLKVYYPTLTDETETSTSMTFTFKDAHGNDLTNISNLFTTGAYVKVVLDTTNGFAYIQNADTNGYLENKFNNIDVSTPINAHNTSSKAHSDIRKAVEAKYTKPSTGIPKTDLASSVQSSLALADTALQSLPSHNHDASAIVSGILPVIRGGTGVNSLASLATAMGSAKMEVKSYVGNGNYGSGSPTSVTFSFAPKFICSMDIIAYINTSSEEISPQSVCLIDTSRIKTSYTESAAPVYLNARKNSWCKKSSDGKTFTWYNGNGAMDQNNFRDYGYSVLAIG